MFSINGCILAILSFIAVNCLLIFYVFLFNFSKIEWICGGNKAKSLQFNLTNEVVMLMKYFMH